MIKKILTTLGTLAIVSATAGVIAESVIGYISNKEESKKASRNNDEPMTENIKKKKERRNDAIRIACVMIAIVSNIIPACVNKANVNKVISYAVDSLEIVDALNKIGFAMYLVFTNVIGCLYGANCILSTGRKILTSIGLCRQKEVV